jgi:hypothetical protein
MSREKKEAPLQISEVHKDAEQEFDSQSQGIKKYLLMGHGPGRPSAL